MTRHLLLFHSYGLVFVGCPLLREDGSVFCICCWPFPALSFSGPSPLGLATIFYCLRFETSLFVASYDSQGHSGQSQSQSQSHIATDGQSVNLGVEPHLRLMTRYLLLSWQLRSWFLWGALSDERSVLSRYAAGPCQRRSYLGLSPLVLTTIFYCLRFETSHFVASYDTQGHGGGIRPRLHTGLVFYYQLTKL
jgi:hypothetical protein